MKKSHLFSLSFILTLSACQDTTPLDSKFWNTPTSQRSQMEEEAPTERTPAPMPTPPAEVETKPTYVVQLYTLSSANLGEVSGEATIEITDTEVITKMKLSELPQTLMIGQRSLTHKTCAEVASAYPPPAVVTTMMEFKEWSGVDYSTREALTRELNQIDGRNGDVVDLEGKTFVVKAYVETFNTPGPTKGEFIPIACGRIEKGDE